MAARSKVVKLPADIKQWLDQVLVAQSFGGYEALASELQARGYAVSKSSLHRYGQSFEDRLGALKAATEQAKAIVSEVGDEEGATNDALLRLIQEKLFVALTESDPEKQLGISWMPELAKAVANLTRASVQQKGWASKVRKEDAAKLAKMIAEAENAGGSQPKFDLATLRAASQALYGF